MRLPRHSSKSASPIHYSSTYRDNANASLRPEIGVAFCSGGGFFFIFGLILFFDRALLAMGNILFLIGITLLLGPQRTFVFFARKNKWKGTLAFWAGVLLILMRWPLIGFGVELFGIFVLFGVRFLAALALAMAEKFFLSGGISKADVLRLAGILQDDCRLRIQHPGYRAVSGARIAGCGRQGGRERTRAQRLACIGGDCHG